MRLWVSMNGSLGADVLMLKIYYRSCGTLNSVIQICEHDYAREREREREGQTDRQTDIAWLAYRNIKILQLYTHTPPKQVSILLCRQCNAA